MTTQNNNNNEAAQSDLFTGEKIGNCKILEKINEGGTAYIYKAYNDRFNIERVVKILKPDLNDTLDYQERFIQEAQLTARMDHPNILHVYDTGTFREYNYIEMEYISGKSLRSLIQMKPMLKEKHILNIALQVLKALDFAHNVKLENAGGKTLKGTLHRDIKPENIMISESGTVKLMDFGAAKPLDITNDTQQSMVVGTFHYMSPEQLNAKPLDIRSDYFSFGIVLYEMFTKKKPFTGKNVTELMDSIRACKYTPVSKIRPSASPLSCELIDSLLFKNPKNRPSSAKSIISSVNIAYNLLNTWGQGKNISPPFQFHKYIPAASLLISLTALIIALFPLFRSNLNLSIMENEKITKTSGTLLNQAMKIEEQGLWKEAASTYELVPPPEEGGNTHDYLQSRLRASRIYYSERNQLTKARSILEQLRSKYSDPAINLHLGRVYLKQALHNEAINQFEHALSSSEGSVMDMDTLTNRSYYNKAVAFDNQYTFVDRDSTTKANAISAWQEYTEKYECSEETDDKKCEEALKRIEELSDREEE